MIGKVLVALAAVFASQPVAAQQAAEQYGERVDEILMQGFVPYEQERNRRAWMRGEPIYQFFFAGYGCRSAEGEAVDCLRQVFLWDADRGIPPVLREGRFDRTGPGGEWRHVAEAESDWRLFNTINPGGMGDEAFYDAASLRRNRSGFTVRYVAVVATSGVGNLLFLWDVPILCDASADAPLPVRPGGEDFLLYRDVRNLRVVKRLLCPAPSP